MEKETIKNEEIEEKDEKEEEIEDIMGKVDEKEKKEIEENKETKEDDEEKTEEKQEIKNEESEKIKSSDKDTKKLVILLCSVLVIFIITFMISRYFYNNYSTPEYPQYEYNGFKFVKIAGLWHTQWQQDDKLYNVHLRYGPKESEDIPYYAESSSFDPTGTIYITFDPGESKKYVALASTELSLSMANTFNITPIAACTENKTGCGTRPIITCKNTEDAVIYIKEAAEPSITTKENCLIIQGDGEDLVRAADKILWIWYGVIK